MSETAPLYRQMFRLDTKKPPPKKPPPRSERYRLARPWTGSGLRARMRHHDGRAARRPGPPPKSQSWRGGRRGGPCNRRPGAPCPQVGVNYQLPSELSLAVSRLAKEPGLGSPTYRAPTGGWGRWHGYDRMHGRRCGGLHATIPTIRATWGAKAEFFARLARVRPRAVGLRGTRVPVAPGCRARE